MIEKKIENSVKIYSERGGDYKSGSFGFVFGCWDFGLRRYFDISSFRYVEMECFVLLSIVNFYLGCIEVALY